MRQSPAIDRNTMREINKNTIFNLVRSHAPVSRPSLAELSGLSLGTVITITNNLIDRQLIFESDISESTGGRKAGLLEIHPEGAYAIGLFPAEKMLEGMILSLNGEPYYSETWEVTFDSNSFEGLNLLAQKTNDLIEHSGVPRAKIIGVSCGLPGTVNPETGYCVDSWHFGWHNVPVREQLSNRLNLPVFVDNVLNCLSCYELLFGQGRYYHNFLVVAVGGRGLGLGLVINGALYRGSAGGGAEFGHTIYQLNGRQCECGNKGCIEEYVVDRGIVANYRELVSAQAAKELDQSLPVEAQLELLLAMAKQGDKLAQAAFEHSGTILGVGLANLVNLFNPECVVLTGYYFDTKDYMLQSIRTALQENTFSQLGKKLKLVVEPLNKNDGARGAGSLAVRNFFSYPSSSLQLREPA